MPDRDPEPQQSARLLTGLIWGGLGLAPVAALVALLGGDTALRFAVLLTAVCVVLLGAALLVRNDPVVLRLDAEDRLAAETAALRDEMREEVAAAARATSHRVQVLQDEMTRMRGAASPAHGLPLPGPRPATASAAVPGMTAPEFDDGTDDDFGYGPAEPATPGRAVVAAAAVVPAPGAMGHTAVARIPAVAAAPAAFGAPGSGPARPSAPGVFGASGSGPVRAAPVPFGAARPAAGSARMRPPAGSASDGPAPAGPVPPGSGAYGPAAFGPAPVEPIDADQDDPDAFGPETGPVGFGAASGAASVGPAAFEPGRGSRSAPDYEPASGSWPEPAFEPDPVLESESESDYRTGSVLDADFGPGSVPGGDFGTGPVLESDYRTGSVPGADYRTGSVPESDYRTGSVPGHQAAARASFDADPVSDPFEAVPGRAAAIPGRTSAAPGRATAVPGSPGRATAAPGSPGRATAAPGSPGRASLAPGRPPAAPTAPGRATAAPAVPDRATAVPGRVAAAPASPGRASAAPGRASAAPGRATPAPGRATPVPGRGSAVPVPHQRSSASVPIPAFDDHTNPPDPRTPTGYAPGPSGSAWAERGEPDDDPGYTPRRQARRHAAPDTGTDLARYGLSAPDLDDQGGYQPQDDYYAEPHAEAEGDALNGGFVSAADDFDSSGGFFAGQPDFRGYADEDPAPPPPTVYGRARDKEPDQYGPDQYGPDHYDPEQYGPDPMAEPDGWTPRSRW